MATKFSDIEKPARDLLNDDYTSKISLKCKKPAGPVTVTLETEQAKGGGLSSKVATKFSYAKFNVDKGQVKADGGQVLETSLKISPDIKLSFKSADGKKADLGIDYTSGSLYATGVLDVFGMSKLSTSVCYGHSSGVKLGGNASYNLSGSTLSGYSVGACYTQGPLFTSLTATAKLSQFNIGLKYKVNDDLSIASSTTHSSNKVCDVMAIGAAYKVADIGTIKAKMGSNGILHACLVREIAPKVTLTAAGSMSPSDPSTFKPGLGISM